jgi:N-acyl homoserine lactone hydrolase
MSMKLYILDCGQMWTEHGFLWHFGSCDATGEEYREGPFGIRNIQFFIDHPKAKVVFDLGFTREWFEKLVGFPHRKGPEGFHMKQAPDQNPIAQLAKIGVRPEDVDYVIISHLMSEHAGYLPQFANTKAKIVVQEAEQEYATRIGIPPRPGDEPAVEQFHTWMYVRKYFEVPGLDFMYINGDYELLGKDVEILSLPGHTPGFQNVMVRLPKTGPIFLSACEHRGMYYDIPVNGYAPGIPHAFTWSAAGELWSFKRVRDLVDKEEGQIFFGHDLEQFLTLKAAPEYYD